MTYPPISVDSTETFGLELMTYDERDLGYRSLTLTCTDEEFIGVVV